MRSLVCLLVLAGCLDDAVPQPPPETPAPRLMKPPPPPLAVADLKQELRPEPPADLQFGRDVELRPAVSDGRLELIPIVTKDLPEPTTGYLTLQAGLASGQVVAMDSGQVDLVTISNRSDKPLAILGGELMLEGEQDRLTVHDTVISAHRSQTITVVCAEAGRKEGGRRFRASHVLAEPTLRRMARANEQFDVWERIDALNGTSSDSYRHAAAHQRRGVNADRLRHLVTELDRVDHREERSKAVGFAVAIDHRVIAIEHFATPQLFHDLREQVIASYLPGSIGKPRAGEPVDARAVRAFRERTGAGGPVPPRNRAAARN